MKVHIIRSRKQSSLKKTNNPERSRVKLNLEPISGRDYVEKNYSLLLQNS